MLSANFKPKTTAAASRGLGCLIEQESHPETINSNLANLGFVTQVSVRLVNNNRATSKCIGL